MNVTLKLPDELCKTARHRAVDEGLSLSKWVKTVLERELLEKPMPPSINILELLGDERLAEIDFIPPRSKEFPKDMEW
jgi:inhibitor of KinA sporulation pathway (predicted exonuclease)